MKLAIMQPYLFPHLGYFQLIRAVDTFVVYDDVNYINKGWINRNYILAQGNKLLVTLPLRGASQNRLINQIRLCDGREKILKTIRHCYSKAPHFPEVFPLIEEILLHQETNLVRFLDNSLRQVCNHLALHPQWRISSTLKKENELRGQEKVLAICKELGASHYINAPGGKELYDQDAFADRGTRLSFIQSKPVAYRQFGKAFVPNLSIIDVMMFNDKEQCTKLLGQYDLV